MRPRVVNSPLRFITTSSILPLSSLSYSPSIPPPLTFASLYSPRLLAKARGSSPAMGHASNVVVCIATSFHEHVSHYPSLGDHSFPFARFLYLFSTLLAIVTSDITHLSSLRRYGKNCRIVPTNLRELQLSESPLSSFPPVPSSKLFPLLS